MKEFILIPLFGLIGSLSFADDFEDILQDLAVQTACLGQYSATEAGRYAQDDPIDYYTPPMMAQRFSQMSGERTKIDTFYGVCFDYAQSAYDDIKKYRNAYERAGMKHDQWYIAAVDRNPNQITLYDPVTSEKADIKFNGVFLKTKSRHNVRAHGGATDHAWLWVYRNNGEIYWVDPTWTDNMGMPIYGKVINGEERYERPDNSLCIVNTNVDKIRVVNNTGYTVYYVKVSPITDDKWGADIMEDDILSNGEAVNVTMPSLNNGNNRYDIQLIDADGDSYSKYNISLYSGQNIVFTFSDLDRATSNNSNTTSTYRPPSTTTTTPTYRPPSNTTTPTWLGASWQFGSTGDFSGDIGLYCIDDTFGFSLNYCWADIEVYQPSYYYSYYETQTNWAIMGSFMLGFPIAKWLSLYGEAGLGYGSSFAWRAGARAGFHFGGFDLDVFYAHNNIIGNGIGIGIGFGW